MTMLNVSRSPEDWKVLILQHEQDRCDLDILLKDAWRHKAVIRDTGTLIGAIAERHLDVELSGKVGMNDAAGVASLAVSVLHLTLAAYGHGSSTAIAILTSSPDAAGEYVSITPSLADYRQWASRTLAAIVAEARVAPATRNVFLSGETLLSQGLFDALLVIADKSSVGHRLLDTPLSVVVSHDKTAHSMRWTVRFDSELFEDRVVDGLLEILRGILGQINDYPQRLIADLELISAEQRGQLLAWNDTDGDYPDTRIEALVAAAVFRSPDQTAVICGQRTLTYRELEKLCQRVAHGLSAATIALAAGELVALHLDKSHLAVVAPLAIWKAHAAFVPIDPAYPTDRTLFTLRDTGARLMIVNRHHIAAMTEVLASADMDVMLVAIEDLLKVPVPQTVQRHKGSSRDTAYVTYTSGTTGYPKGVVKEHYSVVNSITDLSERYGMNGPDEERVVLFSALVFEPFLRQMLIALINSKTLVVVTDDIRADLLRFPEFLAHHRCTYLNGTRSVLQHFDLQKCVSLKRLILVGEELTSSGLRILREKFDGWIINEYAFSETAFVTAIKAFEPGDTARPNRSIGRPLRNVRCYVLSETLKQVPIGAIGELYIGGSGVARGYLNRDDLTAERFIPNPFDPGKEKARDADARMYKTGDLARMLPNGEVEFMGRADFQLKLNGIRVEPGEIEARILEYPGVRQCIVMPQSTSSTDGEWRLIGYFVTAAGSHVTEAELLLFLEARLIRAMVPARLVKLAKFPVNINGKADRTALPPVVFTQSASKAIAPVQLSQADVELTATIRELWADVLRIQAASISPEDDIFRLGGQSITCMVILMRLWQRLRVVVTVEDLYRLKTLGNLVAFVAEKLTTPDAANASLAASQTGLARANGLQQGLIFEAMKNNHGSDAYIMQSLYRYHSEIDPDLMLKAWQHVQVKFPSLRLRFEWSEDFLQIVGPETAPVAWLFVDLTLSCAPEQREALLSDLRHRDRSRPYRLDQDTLFRVYLVKLDSREFALLFSCHHIILDGWSLPLLHDEVHRIYLHLVRGQDYVPGVDKAYFLAQRYWQEHRDDHVSYWTDQIALIDERGDFGGLLNAQSRYKVAFHAYDQVKDHQTWTTLIPASQLEVLDRSCAKYRVTLHSILQFVWHKVLHSIGGAGKTTVGTIVAGRNLPIDGIEHSVGLFINTLPLMVDHHLQQESSVAAAIVEIQNSVNIMNSRSVVELGRLQSKGAKRRLFDTLLVLENYPQSLSPSEACRHQDLLQFELEYDSDKVGYPIAVVARPTDGGLSINLWYAGELFPVEAIETLADTIQTLFTQLAHDFTGMVGDLNYLSPKTLAMLDDWNHTEASFPQDRTLAQSFESAAARWPDVIALVHLQTRLTYRELNRRANRLAHHLLSYASPQPDQFIGIVMNKSEWMIISILAVWKAGAAYVPIDPGYPEDRIAFMLSDTATRVVLTDSDLSYKIQTIAESAGGVTVAVQDLQLDKCDDGNPITAARSTSLAYAIYTSGTTGRPKAVLIEHIGVANLHASLEKTFKLNRAYGEEVVLSFSNYVFDHFVEQMTDALLSGQTLVLLDDRLRTDKAALYAFMNANRVTYLSGTPSVLSMYDYAAIPSLTRIDATGEDFSTSVFNRIRSGFRGTIINGYGPTEISITSHKRPYLDTERREDKSIGFPVANTCCFVLNDALKRVPIGGIGQLHIGGMGVARGYLNREQLTTERFITNPFRSREDIAWGRNARLYKTGDLARWLPNGELEYLGRNDLQVKIHGVRVELGEVEAVLSSYPGIKRSFVIAREQARSSTDGLPQKYLVGFYLGDSSLNELEITQWMRTKLPHAVVPTRIVRIDDVPITSSGKLDVARLPEAESTALGSATRHFVVNALERELCVIWGRVLGLNADEIGRSDDFFSLGGDSLRAIRLAQQITEAFAVSFGVADIFDNVTIDAQGRHLVELRTASPDRGLPSAAGFAAQFAGDPPVSLAQERLLFIDVFMDGTEAYNVPFVFRIRNTCSGVVEAALHKLVVRHAALRTLLRGERDGHRLQQVMEVRAVQAMLRIPERQVEDRAQLDRALVQEALHLFRLDSELPARFAFFTCIDERDVLYVSVLFHHTAFDGWSWNIFRREFNLLLRGEELPQPPSTSYGDFAAWQRAILKGERLETLRQYWQEQLQNPAAASFPADYPRPALFDYRGREITFAIERETTDCLRALARRCRISLFSVLLGGFFMLLRIYSAEDDLIVGTPSVNRGQEGFEDIVGFFANLLPLRVRLADAVTLSETLRMIGMVTVNAQRNQEFPFEQIVKMLSIEKDPSRHPLVQTVFSLVSDKVVGSGAEEAVGLLYTPNSGGLTTVKFDLSVTVLEAGDHLTGNFTFADSLFDQETVTEIVASYNWILEEFARLGPLADVVTLGEIDIAASDRRAASPAPPGVPDDFGERLGLATLFETVALKTPDAVALIHGDTSLTYAALNKLADRMADSIAASYPIASGDLVALVLGKSVLMIVSILAIWKSGAAYVPIDPDYPDARMATAVKDAGVSAVICDRLQQPRLEALDTGDVVPLILCVQDLAKQEPPVFSPRPVPTGADVAYAIYTSGTTGTPKAVMVRQGSVAAFRDDIVARYFCAVPDVRHGVLMLANFIFDFSVEQLALSVLSGHTLILPINDGRFEDEDYDYVNRNGLTYVSGTPTQLQQFDFRRFKNLQIVLAAGETLTSQHFHRIRSDFGGLFFNAYGTTETCVYNTVKRFDPGMPFKNSIGEPLQNTGFRILDRARRIVPIGAVGELHLSGDCIAVGYIGREKLTEERFPSLMPMTGGQSNPSAGAREYRTGDMVRLRADGELEFRGRNDTQVKIRGLRIELGEIEAAVGAFPGVSQCAVAAQDAGSGPKLYAYYVAHSGASVDEGALVKFLGDRLSRSLIPNYFILVQGALPQTVAGKLDVQSLPSVVGMGGGATRTAPRSQLEARLQRIWSEILQQPEIGIDDDFFRSGGDSIMALQLTSLLQRALRRKVSVKQVFETPTPAGFAAYIASTQEHRSTARDQTLPTGECKLLPVQRWFFDKTLAAPSHWNQYFTIYTSALDQDRLHKALRGLVAKHDAFRLRFQTHADGVRQFYGTEVPDIALGSHDVSQGMPDPSAPIFVQAQRSFDLRSGPLCAAVYLHGFEDGSARIWIAMHHLICDSVSWRILAQDLKILYEDGVLDIDCASFGEWTEAVVCGYVPADGEVALWENLALEVAEDPGLAAWCGEPRERRHRQLTLDGAETAPLFGGFVQASDVHLVDVVLSAFGGALGRVTGRLQNVITLEGHGREPFSGAPDVQDTVGWFTTLYPFALYVEQDPLTRLMRTKTDRGCLPRGGIGYGALRGTYGRQDAPLPGVAMNFLGRFEPPPQNVSAKAKWRLDLSMCGIDKAEEDHTRDGNLVDVTAWVEGRRLIIDIDSFLSEPALDLLVQSFESELYRTIGALSIGDEPPYSRPRQLKSNAGPTLPFEPFITLNENAPGRTLFVLPPGDGGAESYLNNLAKRIKDIPLVLFNNIQLHNPMDSFEKIAEYYIPYVRRLQPSGPYSFLGWSFGGVLAFEIAQQLARSGERISELMMIDPFFGAATMADDLGLPQDPNLLDPINFRYTPSFSSRAALTGRTGQILLFKATETCNTRNDGQHQAMLRYYSATLCNNLDHLLPRQTFTILPLLGKSHYSWINDSGMVDEIAETVRTVILGAGLTSENRNWDVVDVRT